MDVSLRQIAAVARCSLCTVSKALRDDPKIRLATRERVKAIAAQMGYRPNPALSRVAGRRIKFPTSTAHQGEPLAFLQSVERGMVRPPDMGQVIFEGARARAEELGYSIEMYDPAEFGSMDDLERVLYNRGVHGILLGEFLGNHPQGLPLRWDRYAAVWLGQERLDLDFPLVRISYLKALRHAAKRLAAAGYQRIGSILRLDPDHDFRHFEQLASLSALEAEPPPGSVVLPPCVVQEGDSPVGDYLATGQPDVVLVQDVELYEEIQRLGFRIPDDLGIAVIYLPEEKGSVLPEISGISRVSHAIGREGVNLIDASLRHGLYGEGHKKEIVLPFEFVWSQSLRAANYSIGSIDASKSSSDAVASAITVSAEP